MQPLRPLHIGYTYIINILYHVVCKSNCFRAVLEVPCRKVSKVIWFWNLEFLNYVFNVFYQRVSIASYANRWYRQRRHVRLSVRPSVTLRYCIKTKKASVMISSPSESLNILVSRNVWFITKFDRGHPKRGRFLRLGWVRTGDFGDFSTDKPPYLRNGVR